VPHARPLAAHVRHRERRHGRAVVEYGAYRMKAAFAALLFALPLARAQDAALVPFTDVQVKHIVALGPWPPPRALDTSNRVSGNAAAIALGERLFNDASLSLGGTVACSTCHQRNRAFTDGMARAQALARGDRNTPSLINAGGQRWY